MFIGKLWYYSEGGGDRRLRDHGYLPDPQRQEFGGKFNVRIPKSLHANLVSEAEKVGVSLNQLVQTKLA